MGHSVGVSGLATKNCILFFFFFFKLFHTNDKVHVVPGPIKNVVVLIHVSFLGRRFVGL